MPRQIHLTALGCACFFAALAFAIPDHITAESAPPERPSKLGDFTRVPLSLPSPVATVLSQGVDSQGDDPDSKWRVTTVRAGDTLSKILTRVGVRREDLYTLMESGKEAKALQWLHPGQSFRIRRDDNGNLLELVRHTDELKRIQLIRRGDTFEAREHAPKIEQRTTFATGVIESSLYRSALKAGLSDRIIMKMVEIFGWDIDFALDIHPGDSFTVVYREDFARGERLGNGEILAAEFTNRGKNHRAVRYTNPQGQTAYYTPDGKALRQAFVRTPVDFRRISSHFTRNRWHPVLGKRRPHRGVDYAARTGTPVWTTGDGQIVFIGRKGGYGKTIIVKHYGRYTTLYGHLSRFKKGLRRGGYVKQGQVIGYVGQTGLATGPHLHYEFRINGVHKNPVTVKLPGQPPMEKRYLTDFRAETARVVAQLNVITRSPTQLAMSDR